MADLQDARDERGHANQAAIGSLGKMTGLGTLPRRNLRLRGHTS